MSNNNNKSSCNNSNNTNAKTAPHTSGTYSSYSSAAIPFSTIGSATIGTSSIGSSYTTIASGPYYTTYDYDFYRSEENDLWKCVTESLTEEEVCKLLDTFLDRLSDGVEDEKCVRTVIKGIIQNTKRVYSEETVLRYIQYLDLNNMDIYKPYIKSRQYSRLALYIESSK